MSASASSSPVDLEIVSRFRVALDKLDKSTWSAIWSNFPNGSCGAAAETLAEYLSEELGFAFNYVDGEWSDGEEFQSHAWIEMDGWIIDITADQFGLPPVIITKDRNWHDRFADQNVRPAISDDPWFQEHCARALGEVKGLLA